MIKQLLTLFTGIFLSLSALSTLAHDSSSGYDKRSEERKVTVEKEDKDDWNSFMQMVNSQEKKPDTKKDTNDKSSPEKK